MAFVAQRVQQRDLDALDIGDARIAQHLRDLLERGAVVVVTGELLFDRAHVQQVATIHLLEQLLQHRDVVAHLGLHLAKLGIAFDELLHVLQRGEVSVAGVCALHAAHRLLDVHADLAPVQVHVALEEGIVCRIQHHLGGIASGRSSRSSSRSSPGGGGGGARLARRRAVIAEHHTVILDADQIVHHGLVGPLREQRRDRIVASVQNQQNGRLLAALNAEETALGLHAPCELTCHLAAQLAGLLVAQNRLALQREDARCEAVAHALGDAMCAATVRGDARPHVQREAVRLQRKVVRKVLVYAAHQLAQVCGG
mmetsp:Transcript_4852/g.14819  ORF Transcript_4852/g.14819 Transcript_4852/m.14819 type:complete len:312 (+) Transcript_4852:518-1453(+)